MCNVKTRNSRSRSVQGQPRSLILVPIESAYAVSYWCSIVTLVVSCTVSEIRRLIGRNIAKIAHSNPPQSHKSPSLGVTPCEFFDDSYLARSSNHGAIRRWNRFHTIPARAGLRTKWAWCCCTEKGLFSSWHWRLTKKSRTLAFDATALYWTPSHDLHNTTLSAWVSK